MRLVSHWIPGYALEYLGVGSRFRGSYEAIYLAEFTGLLVLTAIVMSVANYRYSMTETYNMNQAAFLRKAFYDIALELE